MQGSQISTRWGSGTRSGCGGSHVRPMLPFTDAWDALNDMYCDIQSIAVPAHCITAETPEELGAGQTGLAQMFVRIQHISAACRGGMLESGSSPAAADARVGFQEAAILPCHVSKGDEVQRQVDGCEPGQVVLHCGGCTPVKCQLAGYKDLRTSYVS